MLAILICDKPLCSQCVSNSVIGAPLHLILMDLRFICIRKIVHKNSARNSIYFLFLFPPVPNSRHLSLLRFSRFFLRSLSLYLLAFLHLFIQFYYLYPSNFFFVSLVRRPKVQNLYVSLFRYFSLWILMYFSNTLYNKFNDPPTPNQPWNQTQ
jgi:hypothetical protein